MLCFIIIIEILEIPHVSEFNNQFQTAEVHEKEDYLIELLDPEYVQKKKFILFIIWIINKSLYL